VLVCLKALTSAYIFKMPEPISVIVGIL